MDKIKRLASENKVAVVSAIIILLFILAALFAPVLTPYSPKEMDMAHRLSPPSPAHLLGTDFPRIPSGRRAPDADEHGARHGTGTALGIRRREDG